MRTLSLSTVIGARLSSKSVPIAVRFWRQVKKGPRCWEWVGATRRDGYGQLCDRSSGKSVAAHRLSWALHHGTPLPPGAFVLHHCDNRRCVRPSHLWLGSAADNTHDMMAKGRQRFAGRAAS